MKYLQLICRFISFLSIYFFSVDLFKINRQLKESCDKITFCKEIEKSTGDLFLYGNTCIVPYLCLCQKRPKIGPLLIGCSSW